MNNFISKYKPYHLDDFKYNEEIISYVKKLRELDDLNVLFVGNNVSNKTTLLHAIIRDYYNYTKTDNISETNVMFVNNLREQGINYYRNEMKTFCQSHSNIYGKKKMIVVDDIDNINEQSQQVFRNYIDKYKNNVYFITICSNIQKVIESLQSRLHIIFVPSPNEKHLKQMIDEIVEKEKIKIDEKAKEYLISVSNNSIQNIMNNLEKIHILNIQVDENECKKICTTISFHHFEKYLFHLKNNELSSAIKILYEVHEYGYSVIDILDFFFSFVKKTQSLTETQKYNIIPILCEYITIFYNLHEDAIELALFTSKIQSHL